MRSYAANAVLDVDWRHDRGIQPPESSDDLIAGKPGVGLLEFISDEQFGRIDRCAFSDQVRVRGDAGDPRSAGSELMVEHQLARGEAKTFSATERTHDGDELFVDDSRFGRVGKDDRWSGIETASVGCGGFIVQFTAGFDGHGILRGSVRNNQEDESK